MNAHGHKQSLPRGRPLGARNKVTMELREMVRASLDKAGGVDYLARQARANPPAFMALLGRVLPKEVQATLDMRTYIVAPEQAASMEEWAGQVEVDAAGLARDGE